LATIAYLSLDPSNDPTFSDGSSLTNAAAVQQAILTRLNLFLGEWWEDLSLGLPVFQSMLGQLGTAKGLAAMQLAIQNNVEGTPYVTAVTQVSATFINGQLSVTVTAQTAFGTVTVANIPGSTASVGVGS